MASETAGCIFALKLNSSVILSVDSQLTEMTWGEVMEPRYNKLIQIYPMVFLGCLGEKEVCEALKTRFPISTSQFLPKSLVDVANLVKDAVNFIMEDMPSPAEFLLIGAENNNNDEERKIYRISKESHSWKYRVDEVVEQGVVMGGTGGSGPLVEYVGNNVFNPEMTEEEGIVYAFEGIKYAFQNDWFTGGDIQVVAINADGFQMRKWAQNDLTNFADEYLPVY